MLRLFSGISTAILWLLVLRRYRRTLMLSLVLGHRKLHREYSETCPMCVETCLSWLRGMNTSLKVRRHQQSKPSVEDLSSIRLYLN